MTPETPYAQLPEFLSPEEFASYLRLGRNTVYELIRQEALAHLRFGRLIRIPKTALLLATAGERGYSAATPIRHG